MRRTVRFDAVIVVDPDDVYVDVAEDIELMDEISDVTVLVRREMPLEDVLLLLDAIRSKIELSW